MYSFIQCGLFGWCLEILWTGFGSLMRGDSHLMAYSSLWMFPIYGLGCMIRPVYDIIKPLNFILRGLIYMVCIFIVEYITGSLLKLLDLCPWDYTHCALNIHGVIRLDYAPLWFIAGLLFEGLLRYF